MQDPAQPTLSQILTCLDIRCSGTSDSFLRSLPYAFDDATAGSEAELQAAVIGNSDKADLPLTIRQSNYYANIVKRAAVGDTSSKLITELEAWLRDNDERVWENSWVRFPRRLLNEFAASVFARDLRADKSCASSPLRQDVHKFLLQQKGEEYVRIPVSYLLKLSLAQFVGGKWAGENIIRETGLRLLNHFLSDNTSPETFSFHVVALRRGTGQGHALAREHARRFLLTHLLVEYANKNLGLAESGQQAIIYSSPLPPDRQKRLNDCIADSFYRELYMSPCLSGWDQGEEKHRYMHLCHQVLSRSQLNAVAKLREAGIVANNLVVLPNMSNISLANNGVHVSLGSRKMTACSKDRSSGFSAAHEKYIGDLVIKIIEHFLPLFVGTVSAASCRIDFSDFHPEKVLGFLPHELDYTHLRMIWRRWRKKAGLRVLSQPVTPFGPQWIDQKLKSVLRLKGDFVGDMRLLNYLVALLSTDQSPGLDGTLGNTGRLRQDLGDMGVFDPRMTMYMFCRLREYAHNGYCGFEGRHYSQFESFEKDLALAVNLQLLVTALAFKYIAKGMVTHAHIPDTPFIESERRQIVFSCAIGLNVFNVRRNTGNQFLKRILARVSCTRESQRYSDYLKINIAEYRRSLLTMLVQDGADLIEMLGLREMIADLERRLEEPEACSAAGRLTRGILKESGAKDPLKQSAAEFNQAAERFYRDTLRTRHLDEALRLLESDLNALEESEMATVPEVRSALHSVLLEQNGTDFLRKAAGALLAGTLSEEGIRRLMGLILIVEYAESGPCRAVDDKRLESVVEQPANRLNPAPGAITAEIGVA